MPIIDCYSRSNGYFSIHLLAFLSLVKLVKWNIYAITDHGICGKYIFISCVCAISLLISYVKNISSVETAHIRHTAVNTPTCVIHFYFQFVFFAYCLQSFLCVHFQLIFRLRRPIVDFTKDGLINVRRRFIKILNIKTDVDGIVEAPNGFVICVN